MKPATGSPWKRLWGHALAAPLSTGLIRSTVGYRFSTLLHSIHGSHRPESRLFVHDHLRDTRAYRNQENQLKMEEMDMEYFCRK